MVAAALKGWSICGLREDMRVSLANVQKRNKVRHPGCGQYV